MGEQQQHRQAAHAVQQRHVAGDESRDRVNVGDVG